jgi:S1-C subfamily serine protease
LHGQAIDAWLKGKLGEPQALRSRSISFSVLGLALSALSACASLTAEPPPEVAGMHRAITGTGFFIGPQMVLTNVHVAGHCKEVTVGNIYEDGEVLANVVASDARVDLAVLSAKAPHVTPARFSTMIDTDPKQSWAIVGYPLRDVPGLEAEFDQVWIDPIDFLDNNHPLTFNGAVRPGNSGSPVLNDRGAVVGIVFARVDIEKVFEKTGVEINDVGMAIPNRIVFDFLKAHDIAYRPATSTALRSQKQLKSDAGGFVRQISCWR